MKDLRYIGVLILGWCLSFTVWAGDLSGYWKHESEPGWMEVRFEGEAGSGTVVRNDVYPERVGRLLLKDLVADGDGWRGQVYAQKLEEYKDAELSLQEPDRLKIKVKVGFISRTVEWHRIEQLPAD